VDEDVPTAHAPEEDAVNAVVEEGDEAEGEIIVAGEDVAENKMKKDGTASTYKYSYT